MKPKLSKPGTTPNTYFFCGMAVATIIVFSLVVVHFYAFILAPAPVQSKLAMSIGEKLMHSAAKPVVIPPPLPTPVATAYPPAGWHCVKVPILMYHHVEPLALAASEGHAQLTVDSDIFSRQMQYLSDAGYHVIPLRTLSDFFDSKANLPPKAIVLTFDDGYSDFYTYAVPVLEAHGFKSDLFVPTGLMENPGYLSWSQIQSASMRGVSIDHHTWSHANVAQNGEAFFHRELDIPSQQLIEHGYGPVTIFAYPYGTHNEKDKEELAKRGFTLAVTTLSGQMQCTEDRLALHRTRIGNQPLRSYGL
ncbi:MAG: polysaccharide deacetylase family protein [Candidatus Woesebacteria bacterium]